MLVCSSISRVAFKQYLCIVRMVRYRLDFKSTTREFSKFLITDAKSYEELVIAVRDRLKCNEVTLAHVPKGGDRTKCSDIFIEEDDDVRTLRDDDVLQVFERAEEGGEESLYAAVVENEEEGSGHSLHADAISRLGAEVPFPATQVRIEGVPSDLEYRHLRRYFVERYGSVEHLWLPPVHYGESSRLREALITFVDPTTANKVLEHKELWVYNNCLLISAVLPSAEKGTVPNRSFDIPDYGKSKKGGEGKGYQSRSRSREKRGKKGREGKDYRFAR